MKTMQRQPCKATHLPVWTNITPFITEWYFGLFHQWYSSFYSYPYNHGLFLYEMNNVVQNLYFHVFLTSLFQLYIPFYSFFSHFFLYNNQTLYFTSTYARYGRVKSHTFWIMYKKQRNTNLYFCDIWTLKNTICTYQVECSID